MSGTERPWHVDGVFIVNAEDRIVVAFAARAHQFDERRRADAELIVRAVNTFDDLVAALREARKQIDDTLCFRPNDEAPHHPACEAADAALARAEGKLPW